MSAIDWLFIGSVAVSIALGIYAWREHRRANAQQRRGDEWWMWAELHRTEADGARTRLRDVERMHANLQTLYADLVRQRLADSFTLIERNAARKRQRRR
jgi:hypothetical protein